MNMLTCYLPWGPMRGVPMRCSCLECPTEGGLPVCPNAYTLFSYIDPKRYLNCFQMVPQLTGICRVHVPLNNFSYIPLGGGCWGIPIYIHILSIRVYCARAILLPLGWGHACLLVCVPVVPYWGVPPDPLSV
jgi:hypothetical protein